ncbi:MAG: PolC-type DNA polymerase III [Chitinophagales bacterium]
MSGEAAGSNWPALLERAGLPFELASAWGKTRLLEVVVDSTCRAVHLKVEGGVEEDLLQRTLACLGATFGAQVEISLTPPAPAPVAAAPAPVGEEREPSGEAAPPAAPFEEPSPFEFDEREYLLKALSQAEGSGAPGEGEAKSGAVLLGRAVRGKPVPLAEVEEGMTRVTVRGEVLAVQSRTLKNGGRLVTFDITDYSDSLTVKLVGDEVPPDLEKKLHEGMWLKVKGVLQLDRYAGELVLLPSDIQEDVPPPLDDGVPAGEGRVELHLHTKMSAMDSTVEVAEVVKLAARLGHPAIAITDHGVVQAFPEAFEAATKAKIKVIYGMEGYLIDDRPAETGKERTFHILVLARNYQGLENLYRLVSDSHLRHFHRHPRFPREVLNSFREGLLIGSACESGELFQAALAGVSDEELERVASFYDFLEIQPVGNNAFLVREGKVKDEAGLIQLNRRIYRLGQKLGRPVVGTGDVHFLRPHDSILRQILLHGQGYEDADKQAPLFYRTTVEMLAEFAYLGEEAAREVVCLNPRRIADEVEAMQPVPSEFYGPQIEGAAEAVRDGAYAEAYRRYGNPLPEIVRARLEKELNSIITHKFYVLYYIAARLVEKSLSDGYLVGSRGSVGSSLVATLTGITEVNPLAPHYLCPNCHYSEFITDGSVGSGADLPDKACPQCGAALAKEGHDIPFETFLGFEGDKVPDIDLNFAGEYQPVAHKYTEELLGEKNVFRAGTIATLADRTAYGFVRKYLDEHGRKPRNAEVNRLVKGLAGVKRTTGQHPGGVMVVPHGVEIHRFTPLQYPANDPEAGTVTTHFDYKAISSRLVKLDILGHDDPSVIRMLHDITGHDPRLVPLDDPQTLAIFSSTEPLGLTPEQLGNKVGTLAVPEYGTRFVRQMLEATNPKSFSDLVRISGLSHGTDVWLNNAADLIAAGTCTIGDVIATRDDIMIYLIHRGLPPKAAFGIMEHVRKGKGVSEEEVALMKQHNVPEWFIGSCQKISYLFPKAHAVAYVTMAFRIAYFKVHFPAAFYAAYFTIRADEFDLALVRGGPAEVKARLDELDKKQDATARDKNVVTILEVVHEALLRGLTFDPIDLYQSDAERFLITGERSLRPPLVSVAGLGKSVAQSICAARAEGAFTSVEDLRNRTRLSRAIIDVLRSYGTLDGLPETDQMSLF